MAKRDYSTAYKLTPTEQALLDLHREFPELRVCELCRRLGLKASGASVLARAKEKERTQILWEMQKDKVGGHTTRRKANNRVHGKVTWGPKKYVEL